MIRFYRDPKTFGIAFMTRDIHIRAGFMACDCTAGYHWRVTWKSVPSIYAGSWQVMLWRFAVARLVIHDEYD